MKFATFLALGGLGLAVTACNKPQEPEAATPANPTAVNQPAPPQGGGGGGIAPLGPNVGGITPVAGGESVGGDGGGSVGAAAKGMAKRAAANAGAPAGMGQTTGGEGSGE